MDPQSQYLQLVERARGLTRDIQSFSPLDRTNARGALKPKDSRSTRQELTALLVELESLLEAMADASSGPVQITLSRSHSIAQFFAFKFVHQPRLELSELQQNPFHGSGIYAVYYTGKSIDAYGPISGTETPIYVGKASPKDSYAETTVQQGTALFDRVLEHAKNMARADLSLADFQYRCATVQSGLQETVEGFLIKVFQPIWNKEVKVAYGIGKHGDASTTRGNRRSPWDTMHPGRKWAEDTVADQVQKDVIIEKIASHFSANPPFATVDQLLLTLTEV